MSQIKTIGNARKTMNAIGRSRNARLNQAKKHARALLENISMLSNHSANQVVAEKDAWQDGRNELEQLVQCFHEANAYNNAMVKPPANPGGE